MSAFLVPKPSLNAILHQEIDRLQAVQNVISDRLVTAYSGMKTEVNVSKTIWNTLWVPEGDGRLWGWLLSYGSHRQCPGLRQVASASRTLRIKIATLPLCMSLINSPMSEPCFHMKIGAERATDPIWKALQVTCLNTYQDLPLHSRQPSSCVPLDCTIEYSHPII